MSACDSTVDSEVFLNDKHKRTVVKVRPAIMTLPVGTMSLLLPEPGMVGHFAAEKSTGLIRRMRQLIEDGDQTGLSQLWEHLRGLQLASDRPEGWLPVILNSSVYYGLEYRDRNLAGIATVDDSAKFSHYCMPWAGGVIDEQEVVVCEYHIDPNCESLDHLLVVSPPDLSLIEQAAEDVFPSSPNAIRPCPAGPAVTPVMVDPTAIVAIAVLVLVAWIFVAVTGGSLSSAELVELREDDRNRFRQLGSRPSLRQLMALRKEIKRQSA